MLVNSRMKLMAGSRRASLRSALALSATAYANVSQARRESVEYERTPMTKARTVHLPRVSLGGKLRPRPF